MAHPVYTCTVPDRLHLTPEDIRAVDGSYLVSSNVFTLIHGGLLYDHGKVFQNMSDSHINKYELVYGYDHGKTMLKIPVGHMLPDLSSEIYVTMGGADPNDETAVLPVSMPGG